MENAKNVIPTPKTVISNPFTGEKPIDSAIRRKSDIISILNPKNLRKSA